MAQLPVTAFAISFLICALNVPALAQDEQCRTSPEPQCQCACREVRSAASFAPRGTCRVIEPGGGSCQLRWFDAARGNDEKLANPNAAGATQRLFLDRVRKGALPTRMKDVPIPGVEDIIEALRKNDVKLPGDPTPFEAAAAYLALDPERQQPELLLACYLIMLGPPVEDQAGAKAAAALVDYLAIQRKTILERVRAKSNTDRATYKSDDLFLVDESSFGCLELVVNFPKPLLLMVKSPRSGGRARCRE
jgi:hypothetical protein